MAARSRQSADDVFINCPFDDGYAQAFRALVFAIYATGFRPRSALELDDGGQTRIEKLYGIIEECRFGIHDLSRTELDRVNALPRFNMPLELGIFLGAKRYGSGDQKNKRALVFDVERYRYQRFVSDLAGMDVQGHGSDPLTVVRKTRDWLANVSRRALPSADRVVRLYEAFMADLPALADALEFDLNEMPYVDYERIVVGWLLKTSAPP